MTTPCFPTDIRALLAALPSGPVTSTFVQPLSDQSVQARKLGRTGGVWQFPFETEPLLEPRMQTVRDFLAARSAAEEFYLFLPNKSGIYLAANLGDTRRTTVVATGSAGQTVTLPLLSGSVQAVYVAGASIGSGYSFSAGTGTNGEDQITITGSYTAAHIITADLTGRLRLLGRAKDGDAIPKLYVESAATMWTFTIHFQES